MTRAVRQRARIARVRRLQHVLAAGAAAEAAGEVQEIETSRTRLGQMRSELRPAEGLTDGAGLARMGELAMRLDAARFGLGRSLDAARGVARAREGERLAARRDQESAERLEQAALNAAERLAARRPPRGMRMRHRFQTGGEE